MAEVGPRSRSMWTINSVVVVVLGLLLVMAQQSMQMSLRSPVTAIADNCKIELVRLGLVFSSSSGEKALEESGLFKPEQETPYVDIAGRRFHLGSLKDRPIVYVDTGSRSINVATAAQILLVRFRVLGIIYFGNGGSLNEDRLVPGDVAVPDHVAYTGAWEWQKFESESYRLRAGNELVFGEFNYPENGKNELGTVVYDKLQLYSNGQAVKDVFSLSASRSWLEVAADALKDLELRRSYLDVTLPYEPKVEFGIRGSSSDIYVKNKAYAEFLSNSFNASVADQESAAIALASLSNGKQFIVFRGISNVPGSVDSNSQLSYLATYNGLLAAAKFIESVPTPRMACQ